MTRELSDDSHFGQIPDLKPLVTVPPILALMAITLTNVRECTAKVTVGELDRKKEYDGRVRHRARPMSAWHGKTTGSPQRRGCSLACLLTTGTGAAYEHHHAARSWRRVGVMDAYYQTHERSFQTRIQPKFCSTPRRGIKDRAETGPAQNLLDWISSINFGSARNRFEFRIKF